MRPAAFVASLALVGASSVLAACTSTAADAAFCDKARTIADTPNPLDDPTFDATKPDVVQGAIGTLKVRVGLLADSAPENLRSALDTMRQAYDDLDTALGNHQWNLTATFAAEPALKQRLEGTTFRNAVAKVAAYVTDHCK